MADELNSVQESIKLALDAADAATDVTSEYSQVKRNHQRLEAQVSQIHKYTTITFVSAIGAAIVGLAFSATLYFKSVSELKTMTSTNRQGLIVFSENIEKLNTVITELKTSLETQKELVRLNKQGSEQVVELKKSIEASSKAITEQLQKNGNDFTKAAADLSRDVNSEMNFQVKSMNDGLQSKFSGLETKIAKSFDQMDKKVANNTSVVSVATAQKKAIMEMESLKKQLAEIRKLVDIQQNRITFP
jgi:hypothetical protein